MDRGHVNAFFAPISTTDKDGSGPINKEREVKDSDDEDDLGSDSDFEDLDVLLARQRSTVSPLKKVQNNGSTTPKAKRTAVPLRSPLAIMPKHKFDMKTLLKHARADEKIDLSARKLDEAITKTTDKDDDKSLNPKAQRDKLAKLIAENTGEESKERVMRAVDRIQESNLPKTWYFFDARRMSFHEAKDITFPTESATGAWAFLNEPQSRTRNLAIGIGQTLVRVGQGPPDDIFLWILDSFVFETSSILQAEYLGIMRNCSRSQVSRLIDAAKVFELFQRLGMASSLKESLDVRLESRPDDVDPYVECDWRPLGSMLRLLAGVVDKLEPKTLSFCLSLLCLLGADQGPLRYTEVAASFQTTAVSLATAITQENWNNACFEACTKLFDSFEESKFKLVSLTNLATESPRLHELRRRMAMACFLDDVHLSHAPPAEAADMKDIIVRLEDDLFVIGEETDYAELYNYVAFLNIAVDSGLILQVPGRDDEAQFDEGVDFLASALSTIWGRISDSGAMVARTEAKTLLELVAERLQFSVRTRRKQKIGIFDQDYIAKLDAVAKQQDYMRKFLNISQS